MIDRRTLLQSLAASFALADGRHAFAAGPEDPRLVLVILRGGLDGLAALPPRGDPDHLAARGPAAVTEGVIPLDATFGLHPALAPLVPLWERGELLPVAAVAAPYRQRSHFDGQDVLENGTARPYGAGSGWLARAIGPLDGPPALAIGRRVPLVLQGPCRATCADPLRSPPADAGWFGRMRELYAGDQLLGPALEEGLATRAMLARYRGDEVRAERGRDGDPLDAARILGRVLAAPEGPRVAVVEASGWDTHAGQENTLRRQLGGLAEGLVGIRDGAGEAWSRTVVLVVTEFGRRVAGNGTGGTDHGVGGAALLAGGAVRGGRVLADWPGLGADALLEGRDLRPTTDLRSVCAGLLSDHLGVPEAAIRRDVFPDAGWEPTADLVG